MFGVAAAAGGSGSDGGDKTAKKAVDISSSKTDPKVEDVADKVTEKPKATEKPKPKAPELTKSQENAVKSAENYLSFAPFSRNGLIRQLSSDAGDGYPKADATFAVDSIDVDWNEQAAKAAKNYLDMTSFSRQGLIEQLSSDAGDGYTVEQATFGVDKAGL